MSSAAGALQVEYLALALSGKCPGLDGRIKVLAGEMSKEKGVIAALSASHTLVILTKDIFECPCAVGVLEAMTKRNGGEHTVHSGEDATFHLLHEQDPNHGGFYNFGTLIDLTPKGDCVGWNTCAIAHTFDRPLAKRNLLLERLLITLGASPKGEGGPLAPLPLPLFHRPEAVQDIFSAAKDCLLCDTAPRVIVMGGMGGMGKSTLASALAHDSDIKKHFEEVLC